MGKILSGGWLEVPILHIVSMTRGYSYSNLMLAFAVVITLGGVLYLRSYRGVTAIAPVKAETQES